MSSIDMLIKIAEYFGITTDFLLGLSENHTLNTTGLSETQIAHIQTLIDDIRGKWKPQIGKNKNLSHIK